MINNSTTITEAGTIQRKAKVKPIEGSVLDNNKDLVPPTPLDFAHLLDNVVPRENQNYFVFSYYMNEKIESENDPYLCMFLIGVYETKEEAKCKIAELSTYTNMRTWAISKVNEPFVFRMYPQVQDIDVDFYTKNSVKVITDKNYKELEQKEYDTRLREYEQMIEDENRRYEYGKKISDIESYEHFELNARTLAQSLRDLKEEEKKIQNMKESIANRRTHYTRDIYEEYKNRFINECKNSDSKLDQFILKTLIDEIDKC